MKRMGDYTTYCTEEQTKRAYKLSAPIEEISDTEGVPECWINSENFRFYKIPTTQQMIGWLRQEMGIEIFIQKDHFSNGVSVSVLADNDVIHGIYKCPYDGHGIYNTVVEAEICCINAALDYLEKKGEEK